ncbi:hypothetical protein LTR86_011104 [Recurvomyces mirabilis]|nr:hypothetical protein LTR86_011104 [Recurvomyces mirabilis]
MRISIGRRRFIFGYKVRDEAIFQDARRGPFAEVHGREQLKQETSATPSTSDIRIDDWVLHGVFEASPTSVIHAASNVRSGEVVAVKRLCYARRRYLKCDPCRGTLTFLDERKFAPRPFEAEGTIYIGIAYLDGTK